MVYFITLFSSNIQIFQAEARRLKVKESRKRREERQALKKEELLKAETGDAPAEKTSCKK